MLIDTANNPNSLKNVSIITRYCAVEKPYWMGFLNHYRSLGVEHVHVCVQREDEYQELVGLKNPADMKIFLHRVPEKCTPNIALLNIDFSIVRATADLLMLIDCDEYFVATSGSLAVEDIFKNHSQPLALDLHWIMNPVLDPTRVPTSAFFGGGTKQIARARDILGIASDHGFQLRPRSNNSPIQKNAFVFGFSLVHFWSRSFRDCLLKVFLNRFIDFKSSDQAGALQKIRAGELPNRLKLLAFIDVQPKPLTLQMPVISPFDAEAEEELLRKYLSAEDEKIVYDSFVSYKETLLRMDRRKLFYPDTVKDLIELGSLLP